MELEGNSEMSSISRSVYFNVVAIRERLKVKVPVDLVITKVVSDIYQQGIVGKLRLAIVFRRVRRGRSVLEP